MGRPFDIERRAMHLVSWLLSPLRNKAIEDLAAAAFVLLGCALHVTERRHANVLRTVDTEHQTESERAERESSPLDHRSEKKKKLANALC